MHEREGVGPKLEPRDSPALTLFRMDLFEAAHGCGGQKGPPP